ncbi:MAG: hypothetical protein LC104_01465 [Bacteroidales bacterium]|nr:hypothetical protein [Bacteroidales bacterium]
MKSFNTLGTSPAGLPVAADDLLEFHAARLLLLFSICGVKGRIDGLTKMAKLDFFVRYPQFFDTACQTLGLSTESATKTVESSMIRFHYGPWDDRYYHILAYLEGKHLLNVVKDNQAFTLSLTDEGKTIADQLAKDESFAPLVAQMKQVKKALGGKAGSTLKKLIYQIFEKEVAQRPLGETIE